MIAASDISVMPADLLVKSSGLPALRLCAEKRNKINSPGTYRLVASDVLKTFAPEHLTGARHVLGTLGFSSR